MDTYPLCAACSSNKENMNVIKLVLNIETLETATLETLIKLIEGNEESYKKQKIAELYDSLELYDKGLHYALIEKDIECTKSIPSKYFLPENLALLKRELKTRTKVDVFKNMREYEEKYYPKATAERDAKEYMEKYYSKTAPGKRSKEFAEMAASVKILSDPVVDERNSREPK